MEQFTVNAPVLSNLLLVAIMIGLVGYWAYDVATYDWSKFDEDSEGDDFFETL
jgi:hypothetical protein